MIIDVIYALKITFEYFLPHSENEISSMIFIWKTKRGQFFQFDLNCGATVNLIFCRASIRRFGTIQSRQEIVRKSVIKSLDWKVFSRHFIL